MEKNIGIRIKELRKAKKLTLAELSGMAGISVSFLSQIENGKSALTVVTLNKIANALCVPMKDLFEESAEKEEYVRNSSGHALDGMQRAYKSISILSGRFDNRIQDAFRMTMEPHFEEFEELDHPGEEFYYVLRGTATVLIDGAEHTAREGESVHFPSAHPHKIVNREDEELEMIGVITPTLF
ncbi:helix-turn-helix domain-containing protein [Muricomes intestini]|jgi:transcriptional regulator with XRE-family HTH domain|uniref:XRE family transcriptional regulator n=1 Tax=Muricomes intestini TaxID=1796634 RepID=A0A4R3KDJ6_9FIRM|nr:XRE family transcriptional regulator [Muricomes intestini]TCS81113.1 XRE family transcriptional regulator [Muricomes intestini]